MKFQTIIGAVTLTAKRKAHIIKHQPAEIRFSSSSDEVLLFYRYFDNIEGGKYVVAVVNQYEET